VLAKHFVWSAHFDLTWSMITPSLSWAVLCALPWLQNIPAKIETNGFNKIIPSLTPEPIQ
jgi:hypothetical protein